MKTRFYNPSTGSGQRLLCTTDGFSCMKKTNVSYIIATDKEKRTLSHLSIFTYLIMIVIFFVGISAWTH